MSPAQLLRSGQFFVRRSLATAARPPLSALSASARAKAEQISSEWKGTSASGNNTKNFIGGEFVESKAQAWIDVVDPVCDRLTRQCGGAHAWSQATQTLLTRVPETTSTEFDQAVAAASEAFKTWSRSSVLTRQRFVLE